tara:strand:- start:380 stop:619 length:240 start_codon:yes stop_codon:yes gene_type:complete
MELVSPDAGIFGFFGLFFFLVLVLIICWVLNMIICIKLVQAGKELNNKSLRLVGWLSLTIICIQTVLSLLLFMAAVFGT